MSVSAIPVDGPPSTMQVSASQGLLLGIAYVLFFATSVLATGLTAKRLVFPTVTYTDALWATVFKNIGMMVGSAVLAALQLAPVLAVTTASVLVPVAVYKRVFASTVAQATLVWIAVLVIEAVVILALTLGALSLGARLDQQFNLPGRQSLLHLTRPLAAPIAAVWFLVPPRRPSLAQLPGGLS